MYVGFSAGGLYIGIVVGLSVGINVDLYVFSYHININRPISIHPIHY